MKIFTGRSNPELAQGISDYLGIPLGKIDIQEFSDGEIWVAFEENIRNEDVFIIQSTNPPTDNVMELLLMLDAARRASAKNVIAVNTGTSALHLALDAFGVGKGDEVIVPSLTFAATIQPIISLGATPVFCEVYEQDLLIDLDDVECRVRSGGDGCSCDCG